MFKRVSDKVPKYKDFRKMLDKEGQEHRRRHRHHSRFHACHRGHVVHGARQARLRAEAAGPHHLAKRGMMPRPRHKYKVATQMGNQGYSNEGTRQCAEMIWAGEIGKVTEVHAWTDRPIWPQGLTEIPAPGTRARHARLGPLARHRRRRGPSPPAARTIPTPNGNFYQPFNWRGFYDFGCGALGDMACHILGAPNMALKLRAHAHQRRVHPEGGDQQLHVPEVVRDPLTISRPAATCRR